jgi:hypothetical protein
VRPPPRLHAGRIRAAWGPALVLGVRRLRLDAGSAVTTAEESVTSFSARTYFLSWMSLAAAVIVDSASSPRSRSRPNAGSVHLSTVRCSRKHWMQIDPSPCLQRAAESCLIGDFRLFSGYVSRLPREVYECAGLERGLNSV